MATVIILINPSWANDIILSLKAQNPLTANDHNTMTKAITTHIHKYDHVRPKIP
jgi:hypothetical protein